MSGSAPWRTPRVELGLRAGCVSHNDNRTKEGPMRKRTVAAVAVAAAAVGAAAPAVAQAVDQPHVVTHVTGTPTTGFHVTWRDGSRTYTPTRSEALAECGEYGRATRRAACTAATYTAYRDLTTLKRSLRYAQR